MTAGESVLQASTEGRDALARDLRVHLPVSPLILFCETASHYIALAGLELDV